ncbi:MAG: ribulose-phosphate 3-epimerase [Pleomorphochaeta sp.]
MNDLIVSPSILSADFSKIVADVNSIKDANAKWVHLDVMDGVFVPNITFGPKFIKDLRVHSDLYFDTHLMIENPENYINQFADAGSDGICIHYEATKHIHRALQMIKAKNKDVGISINPATNVDCLLPILGDLDQVLIMSVNPGFGGQSFIDYSLKKIKKLSDYKEKYGFTYKINCDGGVSTKNIRLLRESGIDVVVTGSAFFGAPNRNDFIAEMYKNGNF